MTNITSINPPSPASIAHGLMQQGRHALAINHWLRAIERTEWNAPAAEHLFECCTVILAENPGLALSALDSLLAMRPDSVEAHTYAAMLHYEMQQPRTALDYVSRALELSIAQKRPCPRARVLHARLMGDAGFLYEAMGDINLALAHPFPRDDRRLMERNKHHYAHQLAAIRQGITATRHRIDENPADPYPHYLTAYMETRRQNHRIAIDHLRCAFTRAQQIDDKTTLRESFKLLAHIMSNGDVPHTMPEPYLRQKTAQNAARIHTIKPDLVD